MSLRSSAAASKSPDLSLENIDRERVTPFPFVSDNDEFSVHLIPSEDEISIRAYELWQERGSPLHDSPEQDWLRAEEELTRELARNGF